MDEQGIWAQIVYPNTVGFGGQKFFDHRRRDAAAPVGRALQRRHGRAPGTVGAAAVPDGHRAVVGRRPRGGGDRTHGDARVCAVSTPRPRRTTTACPTSATSTGTRCGRRRAASRLPVNFHIGASESSLSWFGSVPWPSLNGDQKLGLGSAMMYLNNAGVIGNIIYCGRARALPRRCSSCRSRAASAGSRSCSRRSTTRSARCRPARWTTCR